MNFKKSLAVLSLPLAIMAVPCAFADTETYSDYTNVPTVVHTGGFYLGGDVGYGDNSGRDPLFNDHYGAIVFSQQKRRLHPFTGDVHVGYLFDVSDNLLLGAELGYNYLPSSTYRFNVSNASISYAGKIKYQQQSTDLLFVTKYYLTRSFNVFGKAGLEAVYQKTTQDVGANGAPISTAGGVSDRQGQVMPKVELGVGYNLSSRVELTAFYGRSFGKKDASTPQVTANTNMQPPLEPLVDTTKVLSSGEVMAGVNVYF